MAAQDVTSEATAEALEAPASEDSVEPEPQAGEAGSIASAEEQDDNVTDNAATVEDDAHEARDSMDPQAEQEAPAPDETSAVEEEEETNAPS
jgi:hypothetical protein